jgi:hypothetical protein
MKAYKDAAEEIKAWKVIVNGAQWHNFPARPSVRLLLPFLRERVGLDC